MSKEIKLIFEEEGSKKVASAFDNVGDSTRRMSKQVDDSAAAHTRLGEKVGNNEGKFMGTADLLDGLGGVFGVNTQGATQMARALGDLSGGFEIVSGILPAVTGMFPKLAGAMTFISAHPLMVGILVGGAIIGGLILLEKKFGIVSSAIEGMGRVMGWTYDNAIRPTINGIIRGVEFLIQAYTAPLRLVGRVSKFLGGPDFSNIGNIDLPRLDVGGTVLQTGIAVVHRGEVVSPAAGSPSLSAGGTSVTVIVNGNVTTERDLVDAIHEGLLDKQRRTGNLGIAA